MRGSTPANGFSQISQLEVRLTFNSYVFIFVFLPPTVAGFWFFRHRVGHTAAVMWLILASVVFYVYASVLSLVTLAPSIMLDYLLAKAMLRLEPTRARARNGLLTAGVVANVLFLGYFKYKNFFLDTSNEIFATHFALTATILPLGISFITFQKIAFLADIHSGQIEAVRFLDFLLFALFFPRAVAGPIVHYQEVVPQFADGSRRDFLTDAAVAICLFCIGLFKKGVIADSLAQFVPLTFDRSLWDSLAAEPLDSLTAWSGILAYPFQLYFDFSGYSDMALALALPCGVRLPMNFNSPLKASSIVEFWSRWHITLTRFLTAYIYTPLVMHLTRARMDRGKPVLQGKRSTFSAIGALVGLPTLITMTIIGFWHGAGWQFIVYGVLHGIYLTVNQTWRILRPRFWPDQAGYERIMKPLGFVLTFSCVVIAFVFFRAQSVGAAVQIFRAAVGQNGLLPHDVELLQHLGVNVSWMMITQFWLSVTPFIWVVAVFAGTLLLPNSLELLRRYHPALEFSTMRKEAPEHYPRWMIGKLAREGLSLTPATATAAAVLGVLGIMSLSQASEFLYWKF
jgi:alginate O-acetyltransferase complex protein AlgI